MWPGSEVLSINLTVTVVFAVPTGPVGGAYGAVVVDGGAVVVGGGAIVGVGVGVGATTEKTPFIPADAWPATVERKGYRPFFENVTRNVAACPRARSGVFFPAILKSWEILPLLVTVKITV